MFIVIIQSTTRFNGVLWLFYTWRNQVEAAKISICFFLAFAKAEESLNLTQVLPHTDLTNCCPVQTLHIFFVFIACWMPDICSTTQEFKLVNSGFTLGFQIYNYVLNRVHFHFKLCQPCSLLLRKLCFRLQIRVYLNSPY